MKGSNEIFAELDQLHVIIMNLGKLGATSGDQELIDMLGKTMERLNEAYHQLNNYLVSKK